MKKIRLLILTSLILTVAAESACPMEYVWGTWNALSSSVSSVSSWVTGSNQPSHNHEIISDPEFLGEWVLIPENEESIGLDENRYKNHLRSFLQKLHAKEKTIVNKIEESFTHLEKLQKKANLLKVNLLINKDPRFLRNKKREMILCLKNMRWNQNLLKPIKDKIDQVTQALAPPSHQPRQARTKRKSTTHTTVTPGTKVIGLFARAKRQKITLPDEKKIAEELKQLEEMKLKEKKEPEESLSESSDNISNLLPIDFEDTQDNLEDMQMENAQEMEDAQQITDDFQQGFDTTGKILYQYNQSLISPDEEEEYEQLSKEWKLKEKEL